MKIGFIGTGVMGTGMIRNLRKAGFDVEIYARNISHARHLTDEGVVARESVAELCAGKDVLITIIGKPQDVEGIYFGQGGILDSMAAGSTVIDMTTSSPSLARKLYAAAKEKGIDALDAPVSGGAEGAAAGTMTIMPAGDKSAAERCMPLFEAMGGKIFYMGESGNGQSMKLANQVACAGVVGALLDACQYADTLGIDREKMFEILVTCTSSSRQMEIMHPRFKSGNYEPGFMIKHYVKDLGIAKNEVESRGGRLPVTELMYGFYEKLISDGMENKDFSAVAEYWNK
ncbi:MAG: NAD(P)-dependent oxidoreductase [Candidatus Heteroscillospira sp.]